MTILYLYPAAVSPNDMELMVKREKELTKIYRYSGQGFFGSYLGICIANMLYKGTSPYFRTFAKHSFLITAGAMATALIAEKMASEMYYNHILIDLADKYNFQPEEVMELQRKIN